MYSKNKNNKDGRPDFPKRAVITAGMPYGNKKLHFGHVGGLFVHADVFARFLRDRIGKENVIFLSGTDCYGSPMEVSYERALAEGSTLSLEDYVMGNHKHQKETLEAFDVDLDLYGTSAFGHAGAIHKTYSHEVFNTLKDLGLLVKLTKLQFYDEKANKFLNGRQVMGKCPVHGCSSEKAYADECDLGHSFMPSDLIDPVSILTGEAPVLKPSTNWYFKLDAYKDLLMSRIDYLKEEGKTRPYILKNIEEFLKTPVIHLKRKEYESDHYVDSVEKNMPKHRIVESSNKHSLVLSFETLEMREKACKCLDDAGIHYRSGKTLVPFRLSGNSKWGISVPNEDNLTFWCWPESLWAPISFTKAHLENLGREACEWKMWWNHDDSNVYQFIGEDNIYFYGLAEMALFPALDGHMPGGSVDWTSYKLPYLVSNKHIHYMNRKASSSGTFKPPLAHDLLKFYTAEQLRIHFLSLGLSRKSASFSPMAFIDESERQGKDPVLKDGNLLTNIFNRLARSCFYTCQKYNQGKLPLVFPSDEVLELSKEAILEYEKHMANHEFHRVVYVLDAYLRKMNKLWSKKMKEADLIDSQELRLSTLTDGFHALKTAAILLHPLAPKGCEKIASYLNLEDKLWDWSLIFEPIHAYTDVASHSLKHLEPKVDFFSKHDAQF